MRRSQIRCGGVPLSPAYRERRRTISRQLFVPRPVCHWAADARPMLRLLFIDIRSGSIRSDRDSEEASLQTHGPEISRRWTPLRGKRATAPSAGAEFHVKLGIAGTEFHVKLEPTVGRPNTVSNLTRIGSTLRSHSDARPPIEANDLWAGAASGTRGLRRSKAG